MGTGSVNSALEERVTLMNGIPMTFMKNVPIGAEIVTLRRLGLPPSWSGVMTTFPPGVAPAM